MKDALIDVVLIAMIIAGILCITGIMQTDIHLTPMSEESSF